MAIEVGSRRDGQLGAGKEQEIDPEKTVITLLDLVRRSPLPSPPLPLGCVSVLPTLAATDSCYRSIHRRPGQTKKLREKEKSRSGGGGSRLASDWVSPSNKKNHSSSVHLSEGGRKRERAARPPRTLLPSSSQSSDGGGGDPAFRPGFLDWSTYLF